MTFTRVLCIVHSMYQQMLDRGFSRKEIEDAGYFEPNADAEFDPYTHPLELNVHSKDIIIGFSGAFSPFHDGHLEVIKQTESYFAVRGLRAKFVIFPGHDGYVSRKKNGAAVCPVDVRIRGIERYVCELRNVWIDHYPCMLSDEVNFPLYVDRLRALAGKAQIGFVVGDDNAAFAPAFAHSDCHFVFTFRNSGDTLTHRERDGVKLHYISTNPHSHVSSTKIRNERN